MAEAIVQRLPKHAAYVETCCGGAAVFWAKPKELSEAEILNDADGELINFYCELHKHGHRLTREVDAMPYSRALLGRVLGDRPKGSFQRAARFWYVNRVCFGGQRKKPTFGVKATGHGNVITERIFGDLDAIVERLRGVLFESIDVVRLIELYDRPSTLFYVDPPYYATSQRYACQFDDGDHARLAKALLRIRGRFLLSYNDHLVIRGLYHRCSIEPIQTRYTMGCNSGNGKIGNAESRAAELLISNG